mmetsp:Transcript_15642/g.30059  ORF Transcript_15642/g.30059 Transcript_15642/m.30059 type:complete len:142 (-) Transcript_15642:2127-2552(-)
MSKAHSAAKRGDSQTLSRLVSDPEFDCFFHDPMGNNVLHVAALHGNLAAVQVVLRQCGQLDPNLPNYEGKTAVDLAKANRHIDVVEALYRNLSMVPQASPKSLNHMKVCGCLLCLLVFAWKSGMRSDFGCISLPVIPTLSE